MKILLTLILILVLAVGGAYLIAGFGGAPAVEVLKPKKAVGVQTMLDVSVRVPGGTLSRLDADIEQNGHRFRIFSLGEPADATVKQEAADRIHVTRAFGKRTIPALEPGRARLLVTAARPVLYGLRTLETTVSRDLELRFTPPRVSVVSMHHYINHGGSEMVVYRVSPAEIESGVRVGDVTYRGFPASGAGLAGADPSLKVAFFALLYDQDLNTPIHVYATDEAGNTARANFDYRVFPKPMRRSRIDLDDRFIQRAVPEILERSPELKNVTADTDGNLLPAFLKINGDLRRLNAQKIASFAAQTMPQILWQGPFLQMTNSQVESTFADHRTYFYRGQEVDRQVHLGFDLAVTANVVVRAANRGRVLHADYLGIYGNCIIIDHGMGVQSLYAHLSSFDVKPGDLVTKDQVIGRSGMTGLAGGDHLHFTMLINGRMISPVEWWDPHWIEDRITRKLREASTGTESTNTAGSLPSQPVRR